MARRCEVAVLGGNAVQRPVERFTTTIVEARALALEACGTEREDALDYAWAQTVRCACAERGMRGASVCGGGGARRRP